MKDIVQTVSQWSVKGAHIYRKTSPKVHAASSKTQTTKPHGWAPHQQCHDDIVLMKARHGNFVGRQQTRTNIVDALRGNSRLVSLVGTVGVGKSHLALEAISDLQAPNVTTYFCNLTDASSELGIARNVAKAMGVQLNDSDPVAQLGMLFSTQHTILVLDNLEQVTSTHQRSHHTMDESIRHITHHRYQSDSS